MMRKLTLAIVAGLLLVTGGTATAALDYDFEPGDFQGWTFTNHVGWFMNGDSAPPPYNVESANAAGTGRSHDGAHPTFIFTSPEFYLDPGDNSDLTFQLIGGQSDEAFPAGYTLTQLLIDHPNSENNSGYAGGALRNVATGEYFFEQHRGGSGASQEVKTITAAQLDTLDQGAKYVLDFIDWNQGSWGWTQIDDVHIPGSQNDGTLTSVATGNYHVGGTWDGNVPGGVPTSLSIVNVHDAYTVTVASGNAGEALNLDIDATSTLQLDDNLTVTGEITNAGSLNIANGVTLAAGAASTAGMTFGAAGTSTLNVSDLTVNSAVDMTELNLTIDNNTIRVATGGILTIDPGVPGPYSTATGTLDMAGGTLANFTGIDVMDLIVSDGTFTLAAGKTLAVSGLLDLTGGSLEVADGFEVGGAGTVADFVLNGGTLTGTTATTNAEWNFQGGTVAGSSTLIGDHNIVVGRDRDSDGALVMAGTNSDPSNPTIVVRRGALRGLPSTTDHLIQLASNNDSHAAAFEVDGDGAQTVTLGNAVQQIHITDRGAISANAGAGNVALVSVHDGGGLIDPLQQGHTANRWMFGSKTGTGVNAIQNNMDFQNGERNIWAFESDVDPNFYTRLDGTLSNIKRIRKRGDGILEIPDLTVPDEELWIHDGGLRVTGTLDVGGGNDRNFWIETGGKLIVPAGATAGAHRIEWRNNGEFDIAGEVFTRNNGEHIRVYSGSTGIIRNGGTLRAGNNPGNNHANRDLYVYDGNARVIVEAGGEIFVNHINVRNGGGIDVSGNVTTRDNVINSHSGGVYIIRDGGVMKSGNTGNKNMHIDSNSQFTVEYGGEVYSWRPHIRSGSTATIHGEFHSNENLYVQSGAQLIISGTATEPALFRTFNYAQIDNNVATKITVGEYGKLEAGHDNGNYNRDGFRVYDGTLEIQPGGEVQARWMEIRRGSTGIFNGTLTLREDLRNEESGAKIYGEGDLNVRSVYIKNSHLISPGSGSGVTGTLNATVSDRFEMQNGSLYEWEVGSTTDHDLIDIAGKLNLDSTWNVKLLQAPGATGGIVAGDQIDLFKFTSHQDGLQTYALDTSSVASNPLWDVTGATLGIDADSVYITGLVMDKATPDATKNWTDGTGDHKWGTNGNWNPGAPGILDKAILDLAGPANVETTTAVHTVEIGGTDVTVKAGQTLTVSNNLGITAGSLTVEDTGAVDGVNQLDLTGGSLGVNGGLSAKIINLGAPATFGATAALQNVWEMNINAGGSIGIGSAVTLSDVPLTFDGGNDFNLGTNTLTVGTYTQKSGTAGLVGGTGTIAADEFILEGGTVGFDLTGTSPVTVEGGTVTLAATEHDHTGVTAVRSGTVHVDSPITQTEALDVFSGTVNLNADLTTTHIGSRDVVETMDALKHYGYHTGPNGVMDLNNNGAMMGGGDPTAGPTYHGQALLTDGPGGRGLDFNDDNDFLATGAIGRNDNYSNLWLGYFKAAETGQHQFRNMGDDDRAGIWFDLDQDGVFESSTPGLGSNRGEQLSWEDGGWKSVDLVAGESYLIGFTHSEGGGGSRADFAFHTPSIGGDTRVKPAAAAQAGLWFVGVADVRSTNVFSGATVNINNGATLTTDEVRIGAGGTMNINDGALNSAGNVQVNGTLIVSDGDGLSEGNPLTRESAVVVDAGGRIDLQVPVNQPSQMLIKTMGLLQGDPTNLVYDNTPGSGVVTFEDNSLMDPSVGGNLPTLDEVGGTAKILLPITATGQSVKAGELVESFGNTAFKGAYFGADYPNGGTYNGTLTSGTIDVDPPGVGPEDVPTGVYILQNNRQVRYREAIFDSANGEATIEVKGSDSRVWVRHNSFRDTVPGGEPLRVEINFDPGLNWQNTHHMWFEEDHAVPDGTTVAYTNVRAGTNNDWNFRGKVEIGEGASLVVGNNMRWDGVTDTGIHVKDGGVLWVNDDDRLQNYPHEKVTFEDDALLILRDNNQEYNTGENDAEIMKKANLLLHENHAWKGTQGLMLGDGKYWVGRWNGNVRVHGNTTHFRAEAGASWVGFAPMNNKWMWVNEPFDGQGADVYVGSDTPMWTTTHWDDFRRYEQIPSGYLLFYEPVTNVGTMYVKSGRLRIENDRLDGQNIVVQGAVDRTGGVQLWSGNWRLENATITTEDDGVVYVKDYNANTTLGTLNLTNSGGVTFEGGEHLQIFYQFTGDGSVENGKDGKIVMLPDSFLEPGSSVGSLGVDDFIMEPESYYIWELGMTGNDVVNVNDYLELKTEWILEITDAIGAAEPTDELTLFTYGGSLNTATSDDEVTSVRIEPAFDGLPDYYNLDDAVVKYDASRVYLTGLSAFEAKNWIKGDSGNWDEGASWGPAPGEPGLYSNTTVAQAGRTVTVNTGGNEAWKLTVDTGAIVSIDTGGELAVGGETRVASAGTLSLTGTGQLTTSLLTSEGTTNLGGAASGIDTVHVIDGTTTVSSQLNVTDLTVESAGTLAASAGIAASGKLTLDAATVNVTGVADFSRSGPGTNSTSIKHEPDLNITSAGHLTIQAAGGEMPAGLQAHYDAGVGVTLTGGKVTGWEDLSGNGHDGSRSTNATVISGGLNGLDVIDFGDNAHGNGSYLDVAGTFPAEVVYTVFKNRTDRWRNYGAVFGRRSGRNANWLFENNNTNFHGNQHPESVNRNGVEISSPFHINPINEYMVLRVDYNNNAPHNQYFINRSDHSACDLLIAEILVFDRVLTADEENDVGGYLAGKYGIDTSFTGSLGALFGDLTMAGGLAKLTLDSEDGLGAGAAGFGSISGSGTIEGGVTALGPVDVDTMTVQGELIAAADSVTAWEIGDLIDVNAAAIFGGNVTFEDGLTFEINEASNPTLGQAYPVVDFEGALTLGDTPAGSFGMVTNGTLNDVGAGDWSTANVWYNSNSVFIVPSADRLWNGANAAWSSDNWEDDPPTGPTKLGNMVVNDGTVTVAAPHTQMNGALSLTMGGGRVNVDDSLDVVGPTSVGAGATLQVNDGGTLATPQVDSEGTVNVEGTSAVARGHLQVATVNSSGDFSVNGFGKVTADTVNLAAATASFGPDNELAIAELNVTDTTVNTTGMSVTGMMNFNSGQLNVTDGNVATTGDLALIGGTVTKLGGGLAILSSDTKIKAKGSNIDVQNGQLQINVPAGSTPDGLIARWSFEAGAGTTVFDSSGRGFDGDIVGNVTWVDDPDRGTVLEFAGGANDYINVPNAADLFASLGVTEEVTVSLWQRDAQVRNNSVFNGRVDGRRALHAHLPWSNSRVYWDAGDSYDRIDKAATADEFSNKWNHWAFTKNLGEMKIFLNGVEWHSGGGKNRSLAGINEFWIGQEPAFDYLGKMDEFSIYDQVLSDEEILAVANDEFLPKFGALTMANGTELILPKVLGEGGAASFESVVAGDNATITGSPITPSFEAGINLAITGDPVFSGPATTGTGAGITGNVLVDVGGNFSPEGGATIDGNLDVAGTIDPAGGIDGTTTVSGDAALHAGGSFVFSTRVGDEWGKIAVTGELDMDSPFNVILDLSGPVDIDVDYELASYGTLVGNPRDNFTLVPPPDSPYSELLDLDPAESYVYDDIIEGGVDKAVKLHLAGTSTALWEGDESDDWSDLDNWTADPFQRAAIVDTSAINVAVLGEWQELVHTLIIDRAPGVAVDKGGKVILNHADAELEVDNNTHVMADGTLEVQTGRFISRGHTRVYDGGTVNVLDKFDLAGDRDLNTDGTTTFGGSSVVSLVAASGGDPQDLGDGNLNVTGGTTTVEDGAQLFFNTINATAGVLDIQGDLDTAQKLSVDGATVTAGTRLLFETVEVTSGTVTSAGFSESDDVTMTGGTVTTAGIEAFNQLSLSGDALLSSSGNVIGDTVILKGGATLEKTDAGPAAVSYNTLGGGSN